MAHDLFFGKTKRNFARDLEQSSPPLPMTDEVTLVFTPGEQLMLGKIALIKVQADNGDVKAKRELVAFTKKVAKTKVRAKNGDVDAKRCLLVLRESGIFNKSQQISVDGSSDNPIESLRSKLRELKQKQFKTEADYRLIDRIEEKLERLTAMSGFRRGTTIRLSGAHMPREEQIAEWEDRGIVGRHGNSSIGEAIPHDNYRVAVMKAALKSSNGKRPTTADFFHAKNAVDKIIGKAG